MITFSNFCVWWKAQWATTFGMSRISRPGEGSVLYDTVVMQPATATTEEAAIQLTRCEQFGDVRIAPAEAPAAYVTLGAGGLLWSGGTPQRPSDGKAGDRGLYCSADGTRIHLHGSSSATPGAIVITQKGGARVTIAKDGNVLVDAADGKDVVVNGGTDAVARNGDSVNAGTVTAVASLMTGTVQFVYTPVGGTVGPPGPTLTLDGGQITSGAPHFRGK